MYDKILITTKYLEPKKYNKNPYIYNGNYITVTTKQKNASTLVVQYIFSNKNVLLQIKKHKKFIKSLTYNLHRSIDDAIKSKKYKYYLDLYPTIAKGNAEYVIKNYLKENLLRLFGSPYLYKYLNKLPATELKIVLERMKFLDSTKMEQLIYKIYHNQDHFLYTGYVNPIDIYKIEKGLFKKKTNSRRASQTCELTYLGFLRALRSGALYTGKVRIDGIDKRVFIKGDVGHSIIPTLKKNESKEILQKLNFGNEKLIIDPSSKDLKVYSFFTDSKNRIVDLELKYSLKDLLEAKNRVANNLKNKLFIENMIYAAKQFQKELPKYVDKAYAKKNKPGLQRIKQIHNLMKNKKYGKRR
jgi:hypothetical protein